MRRVDELKDDVVYESQVIMLYFCKSGERMTGKYIKENIPYDIGDKDRLDDYFKEVES